MGLCNLAAVSVCSCGTPPPRQRHGHQRGSTNRILEATEIYVGFRGSHVVHVEGILDLNGILELEEKLRAVKMLLKPAVPPMPDHGGYDEDNPEAN